MLQLRGIAHAFGPTPALADVSFDVRAGEVHALLGENGAGKSTLMHVAAGLLRPDRGDVVVERGGSRERHERGFASVAAARRAGVALVHQHFSSIPALTVGENVSLGAGWRETGRAAAARASRLAAAFGLPLDGSAFVESLSVQLRQRLEIVKALASDARVLLLDEPTAVLAPREVDELVAVVRRFVDGGGAAVLISHKLADVFAVADRVTVLRRGVVTHTGATAEQTPQSLSRAMIGADLPAPSPARRRPGEARIVARGWRGPRGIPLTFDFCAGSITGIAAVEGNGQRELLRAIAGVEHRDDALAVMEPVAFVPEDRTTEGLIEAFTVAENVLLGTMRAGDRTIRWPEVDARAGELLERFDVRAPGVHAPVETLSGGNQQKLVLARALAGGPRVLVVEDPSRGLDVLATQTIHSRLRDAANEGIAVVVHSSDLDEVMTLADRLFVMAAGRLIEMPAGATRRAVGDAMVGLGPE